MSQVNTRSFPPIAVPSWARGAVAGIAVLAGGPPVATGQTETFLVDSAQSRVRVHLGRAGLLGFLGHDHTIEAPVSEGRIDLEPGHPPGSRVDLKWKAAALAVVPGTEPAEDIHPMTRIVLAKDGVNIDDREPTDYRDYLGKIAVYYLIIVCDGAAKSCPSVWPGVMERLQWAFDDPAAVEGTHDEKLEAFRRVRDEIKATVEDWVATLTPAPTASTHS